MSKNGKSLRPSERAAAKTRRLEAQHLQEIEDNPLDSEQVAMFEMFEREGWPQARRIAHIIARARGAVADAAE